MDLHEQVAAEIRRAIADGEAKPGDCRLPAISPRCSASTAIPCCGRCGISATRACSIKRGRGVTVTGTPSQGELHERARELVALAQRHGYGRKELLDLISALR